MTKFRTGERVVDIETGIMGRVIATFTDPDIAEEVEQPTALKPIQPELLRRRLTTPRNTNAGRPG